MRIDYETGGYQHEPWPHSSVPVPRKTREPRTQDCQATPFRPPRPKPRFLTTSQSSDSSLLPTRGKKREPLLVRWEERRVRTAERTRPNSVFARPTLSRKVPVPSEGESRAGWAPRSRPVLLDDASRGPSKTSAVKAKFWYIKRTKQPRACRDPILEPHARRGFGVE